MKIYLNNRNGKCKIPGSELGPVVVAKHLLQENRGKYEFVDVHFLKNVENEVLFSQEDFVLILGGDHSTTAYNINNYFTNIKKWNLIIFDAHNDYSKINYEEYYNWNVINKIEDKINDGIIIGYRDKHENMPKCQKLHYIEDIDENFDREVKKYISKICNNNSNIYISIDVDVINPCEFPGTGYKCAGGIFLRELLRYINFIKQRKKELIIDIVEFNPLIEQEKSILVLDRIIKEIIK